MPLYKVYWLHRLGETTILKYITWGFVVGLFALLALHPVRQAVADDCGAGLVTQAMVDRVFEEVLRANRENDLLVDKLKHSQEAWSAFKKAHIEAIFPKQDVLANYGSVYHDCVQVIASDLNCRRISQLQTWIDGFPEGETCSESRPLSN